MTEDADDIEKRCPTCGTNTNELKAPNRLPQEPRTNIRAIGFESFEVVEWFNKPEPVGRPDAVAIVLKIPTIDSPFVLRIKSSKQCKELIDMLKKHRASVWPQ